MSAAIGVGTRVLIVGDSRVGSAYACHVGKAGTVIEELPIGYVFSVANAGPRQGELRKLTAPCFIVDCAPDVLWSAEELLPLDGGEDLARDADREMPKDGHVNCRCVVKEGAT